jgi:hypothetical protein
MLKYFAVLCLSFLMTASPAFAQPQQAPAQPAVIGTMLEVEGKVWITAAGTKERKPAKVETQLHLNDVIETGPKSKGFILFIDKTQFTLSENTRFVADEYAFDPSAPQDDKAHYSVTRGAFEYISGAIAKKKDPKVEIETGYGSIGIRGTKFWAGEIEQEYGVNVEEGRVRVRNDGGETFVDKGKGTSIKSRKQKPSDAMPWPAKKLQLIAATVLLSRKEEVLQRMLNFEGSGKNDLLLNNFLKMKGVPGVPGNMVPGNMVPGGNIIPGQKGGMRGNFPLFETPGGRTTTTTTTTPGGKATTTAPAGKKVYKEKPAADPTRSFRALKGLGL